MVRKGFVCLLTALCLLLCACREKSVETDWTALQMTAAIAAEQEALGDAHWLRYGEEGFDQYLETVYQLSPELVKDGTIAAAGGAQASETAVLVLRDADSAREAREALEAYIDAREGDFTGYVPEEAALVADSRVEVIGRYAALLICADADKALETFQHCFDGTPPTGQTPDVGDSPTDNTTDPSVQGDAGGDYDHDAVLAAWRGGDASGLTGKNLAVLEKCKEVVGEVITGGMTPCEKELAIHDWMIDWAEYDPGELDNAWTAPNPDNDNPYGFFTGKVGICLGYTRTFQLFMDMLDIECLTVEGSAYSGTEDHAWNLVRLDGEWYAVDCTWDDPVYDYIPDEETLRWFGHLYFNVTSDFLRGSDHQWDGSAVPEAAGTKYAWKE